MSKPNSHKTGGGGPRKTKRLADIEAGADREEAILEMIAGALRDQGRPPTIREIGEAFGIASTNGVRYYLDRLEKSGKIRRDRWTSRGIELSGPKPSVSLTPASALAAPGAHKGATAPARAIPQHSSTRNASKSHCWDRVPSATWRPGRSGS